MIPADDVLVKTRNTDSWVEANRSSFSKKKKESGEIQNK